MNVTFLCEIYHHIRIEGVCLKVLSRPVIDYFGMLVDGASLKEVEVFVEQVMILNILCNIFYMNCLIIKLLIYHKKKRSN